MREPIDSKRQPADGDDDKLMAALMAANNPMSLFQSGGSAETADPDTRGAGDTPRFDTDRFLSGLDAIYDAHRAGTDADAYLQQAMADAENAGDDAGLLTVLNETMGFYRSQSRYQENQWIVQRALELGLRMGITGTEAWTTTLINAATAMRAAKQYDQAQDLYRQALDSAATTYGAKDRRLAALHNNLSMLYSETNQPGKARDELLQALSILVDSGADPQTDPDIASTYVNLALVELDGASAESPSEDAHSSSALGQAEDYAKRALAIYDHGDLKHSAHYASALAAAAQVQYARGDFAQSVGYYRKALAIIAECYGTDTDYYRTTSENLHAAEAGLAKQHAQSPLGTNVNRSATVQSTQAQTPSAPALTGMQLAKRFWLEYGKPLIAEHYPQYQGRIAAGLVGHGSECYGFDDDLSRDHDFGPGFCLWLTDEDYSAIGESLQADYDKLPKTFLGYGPREQTPRAQGVGKRVGVFRIGDFFESITGYRQAPPADTPHEWLMLSESTLAAATNGMVFADPLGAFSKTRQSFKLMPEDVLLSLVSRRLGMISQTGQYNLPRMLRRGDGSAAWLSIGQFVDAASSLVFLMNTPVVAGYAPYYKWRFAALRRLSSRMGMRLTGVCGKLERIMRLSGAACYGDGAESRDSESHSESHSAIEEINGLVDDICADIVTELERQGLTDSNERFLEWQRPYVEAHITSNAACLHSL